MCPLPPSTGNLRLSAMYRPHANVPNSGSLTCQHGSQQGLEMCPLPPGIEDLRLEWPIDHMLVCLVADHSPANMGLEEALKCAHSLQALKTLEWVPCSQWPTAWSSLAAPSRDFSSAARQVRKQMARRWFRKCEAACCMRVRLAWPSWAALRQPWKAADLWLCSRRCNKTKGDQGVQMARCWFRMVRLPAAYGHAWPDPHALHRASLSRLPICDSAEMLQRRKQWWGSLVLH